MSRYNSFGIMTGPWIGRQRGLDRVPTGARYFPVLQRVNTCPGIHPTAYSTVTGRLFPGGKVAGE